MQSGYRLVLQPQLLSFGETKKVLGLRITLQHGASKYEDNNINGMGGCTMTIPKNIPDLTKKMANGGLLREKEILSNQWLSLSMKYLNFFYVAQNYNYNF